MQDLRLVGVHDDGEHLLLTDSEGSEFRVELTAELRRAVRGNDRPSAAPTPETASTARPSTVRTAQPEPESQMRPREVQALLRAGSTVTEVAERAGWTPEKVERYAAPIQAERRHVASMVRQLPLRGRGAAAGSTFDDRVAARLVARGVETEQAEWDSWKGESGRWTVVCRFPAGGRQRQATWLFDPTDRTISATDDEARWLGEDEQAPGPVPVAAGRRRDAPVYDVEAEGGLADTQDGAPVTVRRTTRGSSAATQVPGPVDHEPTDARGQVGTSEDDTHGDSDPLDLVSAMRERAGRRRRSRRSSRGTTTVSPVESEDTDVPDGARPQEHPDVEHADEPPLGSHPRPEEVADDVTTDHDAVDHEAANEPRDTGAAAPDKDDNPAGGRIGHDPVTGTADLFADQELAIAETSVSDDEDRKPAPRRKPRRSTKKASTPPVADHAPEPGSSEQAGNERAVDYADDEVKNVARSTAPDRLQEDHAEPPSRPSGARKGRPAVPSWDDIMFGSRTGPRS